MNIISSNNFKLSIFGENEGRRQGSVEVDDVDELTGVHPLLCNTIENKHTYRVTFFTSGKHSNIVV